MKKRIIKSLFFATLGLFLTTGLALADGATNNYTGADSTNNATITEGSSFNFSSTNNSTVENNFQLSSDTGGNSASYNTGNGTINSGNAGLDVDLENEFNTNETNFDPSNFNGTNSVSNSNTGYNSQNNTSIIEENGFEFKNTNNLNIKNKIFGSTDTGDNETSYNTGNGLITTGDAWIRVNIKNKGNKNITNVGGVGGGPGEGAPSEGEGVIPPPTVEIEGAVGKITQALGIGGGPTTLPRAGASVLGLSLLSSILGFMIWKWKKKSIV